MRTFGRREMSAKCNIDFKEKAIFDHDMIALQWHFYGLKIF